MRQAPLVFADSAGSAHEEWRSLAETAPDLKGSTVYKKLTALGMALSLTLLAAGCSSDDEEKPAPAASQGQEAAASQDESTAFSLAPEGADTGGWDSEKYPERVGTSSKDFLLSVEYGVWAADQSWYIAGGSWDKGATVSITVAKAPEGGLDAGSLEKSAEEGSGSSFTVTAGDDGTFDAAVSVAKDTAPGNYSITASDDEAGVSQGQIIQIVAPE